jgi:hypothetical protein
MQREEISTEVVIIRFSKHTVSTENGVRFSEGSYPNQNKKKCIAYRVEEDCLEEDRICSGRHKN